MGGWLAGGDLPSLAGKGDCEGVRRALAAAPAQDDVNFGFQAACEHGHAEAARLLAPACSDISASRGFWKAAWGGSPECMFVAQERLPPGALDPFDVALALLDARIHDRGGEQCARAAMAQANPGAAAWALRAAIRRADWDRALILVELGAGLDDMPSWPDGARERQVAPGASPSPPREAIRAWLGNPSGAHGLAAKSARAERSDLAFDALLRAIAAADAGEPSLPSRKHGIRL